MTRAIAEYLDPATCPAERPPFGQMAPATRELHEGLDRHARASGYRWLHPDHRTIQRDLLGSPEVVAWQEAKVAFLLTGDGAWSELPHLYARYGTPGTQQLITALRELEHARCAFVTDCGMQAFALVVDVLFGKGDHAIAMRQIYNKTKTFLEWTAKRIGGTVTVVDDGDHAALAAVITPRTKFVFAETFTNPLLRAQDIEGLVATIRAANPQTRLVIDSTIASPWAFAQPLLDRGVSFVIGSLTKSLGGRDASLGGYIATNESELGNAIMDLLAMRGGILDDDHALAVVGHLEQAKQLHARRCDSAKCVAAFLARHPRVEHVFHPSLPDHPDAAVVAAQYLRTASIVSFRVRDADELRHRHIADVLVSTVVPRYSLSFDGLPTKVNHHSTVSEYFTPPEVRERANIHRLIRLAVGIEDADDLIACLNWALHHEGDVTPDELATWRSARASALAR